MNDAERRSLRESIAKKAKSMSGTKKPFRMHICADLRRRAMIEVIQRIDRRNGSIRTMSDIVCAAVDEYFSRRYQ